MEYLCTFTAIVLAYIFYSSTKKIYNAGTVFFGFWALITFLSGLQLDNAIKVRQSTYGLILIGLVSFAIGCFVAMTIKHDHDNNDNYNFEIVNYSKLNIICIIIIIYSLYRIGLIIDYLSHGLTWGEIRLMHGIGGKSGEGTLKGGTLSQMIHDDVVGPCAYLISPISIIEIFLGKRNRLFLLLSVSSIILYSISTVSRAIWAFSILYMIVILLVFMKQRRMSPTLMKWLKRIPLFMAVLFLIIIMITRSRSSTSEVHLVYNMIAYLTGGISLFDIHLQEPIAELRTYGCFSLYGFVFPIFFIMNYTGILKYPQVITDISTIKHKLELFVPISDHVTINAYSTLFFNFYSDFGYAGIVIGSLVFGYWCMYAFINFSREKNIRSFVFYLIIVQFMIFSMARIYTIYTTRALSLVWLLILLPKRNKKETPITDNS